MTELAHLASQSSQPLIQLFAGLGNPDRHYQHTRHNAGMWLVDRLAAQSQVKWQLKPSLQGMVADIMVGPYALRLLKPTTYMNQSGHCIGQVLKYYKIPPKQCLVVHDDLDIPSGQIRFKLDGGHGGHNGLRDIISHLKTQIFPRLRIGIDHPGRANAVESYVLSRPTQAQYQRIEQAMAHIPPLMEAIVSGKWATVQQQLHTETPTPSVPHGI